MAEQIVTLYIDDTSLRLMVTDGKRVREWAESPLEPGLVENTVVVNEAEVVAKIQQLFKVLKVNTGKVIVGVSGLRCLTRPITLPPLPRAMLDEAVKREAERALPVPLDQLYLSWQTIPAPADKTQVFLVAIPCKTADTLLKALHQAGLKPSFMNLKPLLLARMVKETTAIIVDVQTTEFDLVIMTDGVPQPIRSLPFPSEALSWEEKLTTIRNELDRTITFYNSNNPEKPLASSVPIFVSGDLADESELCQALSDEVGHPVSSVSSSLDCPEGFVPGHYMANIGLAFHKLSVGKEAGPSVVSLNALPTPYQPKPISLTNILALPGAAVAAGVLALLVVLIQSTSTDIASLSDQLNAAELNLQQKQSQSQELTELEGKVAKITASHDGITAVLSGLEKQGAGINRDLEATIESLPESVNLSSIGHITSMLTITGRSPNERQILSYITKLDSSGRFGDITITNMARIEGEDEGIDFTLVGTLQTQIIGASSMEVALGSLPSRISLTGIDSAGDTLTVNGRSPDEDAVFSYLRALEASGKFSEITLTSMRRIEEEGIDFSLVLKGEEILEGGE
ncbi:PilN domain-containing protein [Chloroflexota bacterium]